MDKSTIFRTLNVLLEHHAIHSFEDGSGSTKYEICRCESTVCRVENRHIHFYCEECRRTFCIKDVKIPVVALPEGYHIVHRQGSLPRVLQTSGITARHNTAHATRLQSDIRHAL